MSFIRWGHRTGRPTSAGRTQRAQRRIDLTPSHRLQSPVVRNRHARDHRHHALGSEIVDELRLRLVEPGRVQKPVDLGIALEPGMRDAHGVILGRGRHSCVERAFAARLVAGAGFGFGRGRAGRGVVRNALAREQGADCVRRCSVRLGPARLRRAVACPARGSGRGRAAPDRARNAVPRSAGPSSPAAAADAASATARHRGCHAAGSTRSRSRSSCRGSRRACRTTLRD